MKIGDFINMGFREYANYDNKRSIPHLMDGLKITERKVLFAFVDNIGYQSIVVDKAGMRAADLSYYQHGATSMIGVLTNMNQDFPGTNNMPLFEKDGQFGTRLNHKASSERYISTKLGDTYKKLFDPADNDILVDLYFRGDKIEPLYYLPKLPMLLINGSLGTGNGYASHVLQYDPVEVQQAVQEVLKTGLVQTKLTPFMNNYYGAISKNHETGQVTFEGEIERKGANTLIITELTPDRQLDDYKEILNALMSDKTGPNKDAPPLIKDYDNESTEEGWRFVLDVPRSTMQLDDAELRVKLKLIQRETENLTVWLPNGKLKRFKTVEALIEEWVRLRLDYYEIRRLDQIEQIAAQLEWLVVKINFIRWWNQQSQALVKMSKDRLISEIKLAVTQNDEYISRLLAIRISNLGIEEVTELEKEIQTIEKQKTDLENTTNKKMMSSEVKALKL
jgi:DNA topoisomerase-2